jgi:pimeloyl-ACP methyl ester carboxylesterase
MAYFMVRILLLYALFIICSGFNSGTTTKRRRALSHRLNMADVCVFSDSLMRVHDNPCLREAEREVCALYVGSDEQAAKALQRRLGAQVFTVATVAEAKDFFSKELPALTETESRLLYCDQLHPLLVQAAPGNIAQVRVHDTLHGPDLGVDADLQMLADPAFPSMRERLYSRSALAKLVPIPIMDMTGIDFVGEREVAQPGADDEELRALTLLRDYVELGEKETTKKYAQSYIESASLSGSHRKSLKRLAADQSKRGVDLFSGEVCSGLAAKFRERGLLSPRLMVHPRSPIVAGTGMYPLTEKEALVAGGGFFQCQLREDAIRKDWHERLAQYSLSKVDERSGLSACGYEESFQLSCGGHLERTGVMRAEDGGTEGDALPPLAVLIHGFGGSMDQMGGMAKELQKVGFEVLGIDLIGFGRSEKPPLSYNQYFWRDQVITAAKRHQAQCGNKKRKVVFLGNSIGGFTAASTAAAFADPVTTDTSSLIGGEGGDSSLEVAGLVLFNSAGRIIDPASDSTSSLTVEEEMKSDTELYRNKYYPAYEGPPGALLRAFGSGLIAALQPNIKRTTEWLYPSNPGYIAQSGLDSSILRDSLDPGARDVMASGAKLPAPMSMNALLECFKGPVLIAQGGLDPLNDAVDRASKFGAIREGITVSLMDLGHCPMDEDPSQCAKVIGEWLQEEQVLAAT